MNKPCVPVTLTPWKPGETTVEFGSQVVIDVESKCKCKIGGTITIEDPGQAHPFFSVDDENYSHAALDFERVRNLHLKESREWKNSAEDEADSLQQDLKTQLLNTAVETGKQVLGDDPLEIGLGLINPWKKVKLGSKLKNLPGAIKDTVRALRGGGVTRGPKVRPSWRQSEIDEARRLRGRRYKEQRSFKEGEGLGKRITRGSVRPDLYKSRKFRPDISREVKNYNVETSIGRRRLIYNVTTQAKSRVNHLPEGTKQKVTLDVRGQNVSRAELRQLRQNIANKSDGILNPRDIKIRRR
jgi:hypothetical protein